jgi:hypothetical protein
MVVRGRKHPWRAESVLPTSDYPDGAAPFRVFWEQRLDALGTEVGRGKRERRP